MRLVAKETDPTTPHPPPGPGPTLPVVPLLKSKLARVTVNNLSPVVEGDLYIDHHGTSPGLPVASIGSTVFIGGQRVIALGDIVSCGVTVIPLGGNVFIG